MWRDNKFKKDTNYTEYDSYEYSDTYDYGPDYDPNYGPNYSPNYGPNYDTNYDFDYNLDNYSNNFCDNTSIYIQNIFVKERIFAKTIDLVFYIMVNYLLVTYYSYRIVPEIATKKILIGLLLIWLITSLLVFFILPLFLKGRSIGKIFFKIYCYKNNDSFLAPKDIFINYIFTLLIPINVMYFLITKELLSDKIVKNQIVKI